MRSLLIAALLAVTGLTACDAGDAEGTARLNVRLTDAPFPFDLAESADVTITRIELLASERDDDAENDTSNTEGVRDRIVLFEGATRLNLLDLRGGIDTLLVSGAEFPADGGYDRLRVFVDEDAEVRFFDGSVYALKLPSAQQSGIKIALPSYTVGAGGEVDVLVDFDVERSFVTRGNPASANFQGFLFKPVLHVKDFATDDGGAETDSTSTAG
ncbi:DUF4382 domain-containing protein [Rubrivirga sp. IMCC43871]|uniref:DUF4382 domain-containing protein n=1 Tax=Rubrivirga sp. IMCC43871 TaxID=3391575 RepID=UPI00398F9CF2